MWGLKPCTHCTGRGLPLQYILKIFIKIDHPQLQLCSMLWTEDMFGVGVRILWSAALWIKCKWNISQGISCWSQPGHCTDCCPRLINFLFSWSCPRPQSAPHSRPSQIIRLLPGNQDYLGIWCQFQGSNNWLFTIVCVAQNCISHCYLSLLIDQRQIDLF